MGNREKRIRRIVPAQPLVVAKGRKSGTTEYAEHTEETKRRRLWPGVLSRERRVSFAVFASFAVEKEAPRIGRR